jgi:1,4-dihydroxy-2-naphthoate polyprenyltransferase
MFGLVQIACQPDGRGTIARMSTALGSSASISPFSAWLLATRPKTLPAAISPVLVGCAVAWAEGGFDLVSALGALSVALLLQIGANLANDVADFQRGADTQERLGPLRVTQGGLIPPRQIVMATVAVLMAATVPGLYLVWRGGPILAVLGLIAIAAAVTYTAGPKPFGYLGLGELFVFFFFGPVAVAGTAFVMTNHMTRLTLITSISMGCLVTAILVVNNLRDIDTDRVAGKGTLAVRIGREATRWEYTGLIAVAYAMPLAMWAAEMSKPGPLLAWATVPLAILLVRQVWQVAGRALNPVLGGTARLCLWFAITFGIGIIL